MADREESWQAWVTEMQGLTHDEYREVARAWGAAHLRHFPGFAPLIYDEGLGMLLFSVDILHLIFINLFKMHLMDMVIVFLLELSSEARQPIEVFLHSKSILIKLASAQNITEVSQSLTGRDCKVMCERAHEILPDLLEWAHAPQEAVEAAAKEAAQEKRAASTPSGTRSRPAPASHDNVFTMVRPPGVSDSEDEDEDEPEAERKEEEGEARKAKYAGFFDDFSAVVVAVRLFESDTPEYRQARAVELFNAASKVGRNMVEVRESFDSAVPHVLTSVVTRQMVLDGDPNRRGCDQSEAIGVSIKFDLHNRCNRLCKAKTESTHKKQDKTGGVIKEWRQKLSVSRVMQTFKSSVLREALRRDPDSQQYLTRRDHVVANHGFVTKGGARAMGIESRLAKLGENPVKTIVEERIRVKKGEECGD